MSRWVENAVRYQSGEDGAIPNSFPISDTFEIAPPIGRYGFRIAQKIRVHGLDERQVQAAGKPSRFSHQKRISGKPAVPNPAPESGGKGGVDFGFRNADFGIKGAVLTPCLIPKTEFRNPKSYPSI